VRAYVDAQGTMEHARKSEEKKLTANPPAWPTSCLKTDS
jgi:hypothetical protein